MNLLLGIMLHSTAYPVKRQIWKIILYYTEFKKDSKLAKCGKKGAKDFNNCVFPLIFDGNEEMGVIGDVAFTRATSYAGCSKLFSWHGFWVRPRWCKENWKMLGTKKVCDTIWWWIHGQLYKILLNKVDTIEANCGKGCQKYV